MEKELLTVEEAARYLKTTPNTVYRWCRSGKLPAGKIGQEWRISREDIELSLRKPELREGKETLLETLSKGLQLRDHVLGIAASTEDIYRVEAAFFQMALARGGKLFKGCWWQPLDETRERLSSLGLPVQELEKEGLFNICDLSQAYSRHGLKGAVKEWVEGAKKAVKEGFSRLWGSGSPSLTCCDGKYSLVLEFEMQLDLALKGLPVVGMCHYWLDPSEPNALGTLTDLASRHTGILMFDGEKSVFVRKIGQAKALS